MIRRGAMCVWLEKPTNVLGGGYVSMPKLLIIALSSGTAEVWYGFDRWC
jgi:hypothetical protein